MKHFLLQTVAGCGLLVFGLSANALAQDRGDHWREYRDSERFYKGRLFERVRTDLDRIQSSTFSGGGDKYRLGKAKEELNELQSKFESGNYDAAQMQDVMAAMDRVLADNRLSERDRDVLRDDKARLNEFRERHDRDYPR